MSLHASSTATTIRRQRTATGLALALVLALALIAGCSGAQNGGGATITMPGATTTEASSGTTAAGVTTAPVGTVVTTKSGAGSWRRISPAELAGMLQQKDFVLVNVHIPYAGEIAGTDLFLPYDQAAMEMSKLPADKRAKIVLYCRSGRMSTIAAEVWADAGYTNLYELAGGFDAWTAAGYPLVGKA
jgi:rhodanese-related sulfurtransferase